MKQSRAASLKEATLNTAAGFGISLIAQMTFLPMLGVEISHKQNLIFAIIMTIVSIARTYVMRRIFEALHIRNPISPFAAAVLAERRRQIEVEGYGLSHDDKHDAGELARAGAAYALNMSRLRIDPTEPPICFPWHRDFWKPQGIRRDLVKGAALILAEGEKHDRNRKRK